MSLKLLHSKKKGKSDEDNHRPVSVKHALLQSNSMLILDERKRDPSFPTKWERTLHTTFSQAQKEFSSLHIMPLRQIQIKKTDIKYRCYKTHHILHKMNTQGMPLCWRCRKMEKKLLHIFWDSPLLTNFWSGVKTSIKTLTRWSLADKPAISLLHDM